MFRIVNAYLWTFSDEWYHNRLRHCQARKLMAGGRYDRPRSSCNPDARCFDTVRNLVILPIMDCSKRTDGIISLDGVSPRRQPYMSAWCSYLSSIIVSRNAAFSPQLAIICPKLVIVHSVQTSGQIGAFPAGDIMINAAFFGARILTPNRCRYRRSRLVAGVPAWVSFEAAPSSLSVLARFSGAAALVRTLSVRRSYTAHSASRGLRISGADHSSAGCAAVWAQLHPHRDRAHLRDGDRRGGAEGREIRTALPACWMFSVSVQQCPFGDRRPGCQYGAPIFPWLIIVAS